MNQATKKEIYIFPFTAKFVKQLKNPKTFNGLFIKVNDVVFINSIRLEMLYKRIKAIKQGRSELYPREWEKHMSEAEELYNAVGDDYFFPMSQEHVESVLQENDFI